MKIFPGSPIYDAKHRATAVGCSNGIKMLHSPMFSIIFRGSGEIFQVFFHSFSGEHRQETLGKNYRKNHRTITLMLNSSQLLENIQENINASSKSFWSHCDVSPPPLFATQSSTPIYCCTTIFCNNVASALMCPHLPKCSGKGDILEHLSSHSQILS